MMSRFIIVFLIFSLIFTACIRIVPAEPQSNPSLPATSTPAKTNKLPTAYIDSIQPTTAQSGDPVILKGHGDDPDGTIIGYQWRSNVDGVLGTSALLSSSSLSIGGHILFFKVQSSNGNWSEEVNGAVAISPRIVKKPIINSFTALPASINFGNSSVLNWNVTDAQVVTIDSGIGAIPLIGSRLVSPTTSTYYTLTAMNASGTTTSTVLVEVVVPVIPRVSLPLINYFTANPDVILYGNSSVLSWNVSNASQIIIEPTIGYVNSTGSIYITPRLSSEFRLTASNSLGQAWRTVQIIVMVR
jgi:hypothetical protein